MTVFSISGTAAGTSSTSIAPNQTFKISGDIVGTSSASLTLSSLNIFPFLTIKSSIVYANPGTSITFVFEIKDGYGSRADSATTPLVVKIYDPNLNLLPNYPKMMTRLDVGLYTFSITLPTGNNNLGDYIVDLSWTNPDNDIVNQTFYQVISRLPLSRGGNYAVSVR